MIKKMLAAGLPLVLAVNVLAVDVPIVKQGTGKTSADLSAIANSAGAKGGEFAAILAEDLKRSGWFTISPGDGAVVISGECSLRGGSIRADLAVGNRATGASYLRRSFRGSVPGLRYVAHEAADAIVRAVKDRPGMASTRILVVGRINGKQNLYLTDYDGRGMVQLTRDGTVCIAPGWFPNGRSVLYTSFHKGYPDVYRIDLSANRRTRIAGFPGLNAGADVSPDGQRMALTLSKDGNPDIYVMDISGGRLSRVTSSRYAAEASPSWAPDGKRIVFVSDKSGSPQLYVVAASGGGYKRITFRGNENVAPDWGPDGRITFSSRRAGSYHVCVLDSSLTREAQMTGGGADHEDPSWAPDARHIVCTITSGHRSNLYVLDTLGDPPVRLTSLAGDWYSAAWSPGGIDSD